MTDPNPTNPPAPTAAEKAAHDRAVAERAAKHKQDMLNAAQVKAPAVNVAPEGQASNATGIDLKAKEAAEKPKNEPGPALGAFDTAAEEAALAQRDNGFLLKAAQESVLEDARLAEEEGVSQLTLDEQAAGRAALQKHVRRIKA